jgi:hypothetical protein
MDIDAEILTRVSKIDKFFESVLYKDSLDDWKVARDLGELLIRIDGEEITGHALLVRACRHIGDRKRAREELEKCRALLAVPGLTSQQRELFLPVLSEEEKQLNEESSGE